MANKISFGKKKPGKAKKSIGPKEKHKKKNVGQGN